MVALAGLHLPQRPPGPAAPTRPSLEPFAREWPSCQCWCVAPFRPWLWSCGHARPCCMWWSIAFDLFFILTLRPHSISFTRAEGCSEVQDRVGEGESMLCLSR
jgi:hypothetical protein